jgi:outer membrane protein assembly factor BamB
MINESENDVPKMTDDPWVLAIVRITRITEVFCLILLALLLLNSVRSKLNDPIEPARLEALRVELVKNPTNTTLIDEIRSMDTDIRSNYFRSQAFALNGVWMLAGGIVVWFLCLEYLKSYRQETPSPNPSRINEAWINRSLSKRSVYALGGLMAGLLLCLVVLSRHDDSAEYVQEARNEPLTIGSQPSNSSSDSTPSLVPSISQAQPESLPAAAASGSQSSIPLPAAGAPLLPSASSAATATAPLPISANAVIPIVQNPVKGKSNSAANANGIPIAFACPPDWSSNWPLFRGPSGAGIATETKVPLSWNGTSSTGILWKTPIPLPGWNSPVVWGDKIFLTGGDKTKREVYCFDTAKGSMLWQYNVKVPECKTVPDVSDDTGYAPATMAVDSSHAFAMFPTGELVCLDFTGKPIWMRFLGTPDNEYGQASSLLLYKDKLILQFDQGSETPYNKSAIIAFDSATGKLDWQTPRPVPNSWSTPIAIRVGQQDQIITCANPFVIAYDPASGKEIWRAECLGGEVAPSPAICGSYVIACNSGASVSAIRPEGTGNITKTNVAWSGMDGLPDIVSPLGDGKRVYLTTTEGMITCVDATNGKTLWSHSYGGRIKASPEFAGGHIYIVDGSGVTHILQPGTTFKEIAQNPLGEDVFATPAFVGSHIIIRGKSNLYCIGN